jgi:pimeloyl-ACP methyl ester carboxylesterase
MPTLAVISEHAPDFITSVIEQLHPILIPHSEIRHIEGMGHEMQVMHPEPVAELIAGWLAEHPID